MLSRLVKLLMVITAIAPIMLTLWVTNIYDKWDAYNSLWLNLMNGWYYLLITIMLPLLLLFIINTSKSKLESLSINIEEINTADNESLTFIIVYVIPFAEGFMDNINIIIVLFISALILLIIMASNSYHFNPLLNLCGYHFYQIKSTGGINFILLSKKDMRNSINIDEVFHLTDYIILEK